MRPWALQAPTKRLCSPPQGQGTWSMPTVNKIGWARWTSNGSTVESGPGGKIITFAFNNTRFAFTFTEVTKELLPSACVSSICIFPFLPCPGYMLNHKFTQVNYWTQNAMEQNLKLSTSLKRTCPYQLWIPRWRSNHLWCQLLRIDQEWKVMHVCVKAHEKSMFYQPLLSSGASKEIPKKTNVMPNTNIIILRVSNTW